MQALGLSEESYDLAQLNFDEFDKRVRRVPQLRALVRVADVAAKTVHDSSKHSDQEAKWRSLFEESDGSVVADGGGRQPAPSDGAARHGRSLSLFGDGVPVY